MHNMYIILLDLYTFRKGQKRLVRSEPSRISERLNSESSPESASALKADWLFTFSPSPPNQISKSGFSLQLSDLRKFEIETLRFLKYKTNIRITVLSIEFTATV